MKDREVLITEDKKILMEYEMSENEMRQILMFLISYFNNRGVLGFKKQNKIYHFNVEKLTD